MVLETLFLGFYEWIIYWAIPSWVFVIPLSVGALFDYYYDRSVPDMVPACLWVVALLSYLFSPISLFIVAGSFAVLLSICSLAAWFGKEIMGWSDVLALPPVIGMLSLLFFMSHGNLLIFSSLPIAYIVLYWRSKGEETAFYPYMLGAYVFSFIVMLLS